MARPPSIGEMDKRIRFLRLIRVSNNRGGWKESREPIDTVWGKVRQIGAHEALKYQTKTMEIDTVIEIRYHPEILKECRKGKCRAVIQDPILGVRTFEIDETYDEEQYRRYVVITAREV